MGKVIYAGAKAQWMEKFLIFLGWVKPPAPAEAQTICWSRGFGPGVGNLTNTSGSGPAKLNSFLPNAPQKILDCWNALIPALFILYFIHKMPLESSSWAGFEGGGAELWEQFVSVALTMQLWAGSIPFCDFPDVLGSFVWAVAVSAHGKIQFQIGIRWWRAQGWPEAWSGYPGNKSWAKEKEKQTFSNFACQ